MTNTEWLRARLRKQVEDNTIGNKRESLASLRQTEWCDEFEEKMRERLIMGRFRYGKMYSEDKKGYDNIRSLMKRAMLYVQTGNMEHLVDIANLALVEFVTSTHPQKHFRSQDDSEHCPI